jgi:nickel-dependent lactate racemase
VSNKTFPVPNQKWFKEGELLLEFPSEWDVVPCLMNGHYAPELTITQIQAAFARPIDSPGLSELAGGKKKVAIIFDDISRPTPVRSLLPHVFKELHEAGVPDTSIRFVCATGCHGAHTYQDFERKLGSDILDRFPVYNHNIYDNCTYVGDTSQGTKLYINSEVMCCDLKIGLGSVITHAQTGFGGGGKIILPGVSSMDSIEHFHSLEAKAKEDGKGNTVGMGNYIDNPMTKDFCEAARLAALDFKIDVVVNGAGKACAIFCGEVGSVYREAVNYAVPHYATKPVPATDIAVVNTYSKGNEAIVGMIIGVTLLMEKGGDLVLVMDCPTGQVVHYLLGSFGTEIKGRRFQSVNFTLPWLKRLIILCPQFEHAMADWLAVPGTIWVKTWKDVMDTLRKDYPDGAKVAVVPDGTIQYLSFK